MSKIIIRKGPNPPDEKDAKDVTIRNPQIGDLRESFVTQPAAFEHLSGDYEGNPLPLSVYIRECNAFIQDKPYYETGARIRFTRGGTKYTYVGSRWGYTVREED